LDWCTDMTSLTLTRRGSFRVFVDPTAPHCGVADEEGTVIIKYDVVVKCTADSLDKRGFLFDQKTLNDMLQKRAGGTSRRRIKESCEKFCVTLSKIIYKHIMDENDSCTIRTLQVTLSPVMKKAAYDEYAGLTFEWENEEVAA
jgi:hypothetical protein